MTGLEDFQRMTRERFGDEATGWSEAVPELIDEVAGAWELSLGEAVERHSTGYALKATRRDDEPVVLRFSFPDGWFAEEVSALSAWGGDGAVRLLEHDPRGALLLERPSPGEALEAVSDEQEAMRIAIEVARRLWVADPGGITTVTAEASEWARTMPGRHHLAGRPFDRELVHEAVGAIRDLIATAPAGALLHGDLRAGTIVYGGDDRGWLATDPRPLIGDREFDASSLLRDGSMRDDGDPATSAMRLQHRFDVLSAQADLDRTRLKSWALAVAVDEAVWDAESGAKPLARSKAEVAKLIRGLVV